MKLVRPQPRRQGLLPGLFGGLSGLSRKEPLLPRYLAIDNGCRCYVALAGRRPSLVVVSHHVGQQQLIELLLRGSAAEG